MTDCDRRDCAAPATWGLYAAYSSDDTATHPRVARYPMPMYRVCLAHLGDLIAVDQLTAGATPGYYVTRLEQP